MSKYDSVVDDSVVFLSLSSYYLHIISERNVWQPQREVGICPVLVSLVQMVSDDVSIDVVELEFSEDCTAKLGAGSQGLHI